MNAIPCSSPILQNSPKGEDLILGYDLLYHFNPIIHWKNGLITYDSSHKDSGGITSSTSNDFTTSVNSVALVGELKTPFLTPSAHIPSIIPFQLLSPSRDEVFREIKDVGEDVAISSLHLIQGDMNLPPLSFHASLDEWWDGEERPEEIETVLKVIPPAYHQYLDVFSKVKAEKPPPHYACNHHRKMEGLLPPETLSQFQILKEAFTTSCIPFQFNPSPPTIVETDVSDYALGAVVSQVSVVCEINNTIKKRKVMSQVNYSGKHPIACDSRKLLPAEVNYEIHEKELLGIAWALKCWRAFLLSLSNPFEVLTDQSSLQYFMSSKFLTHHQARWAEFLSEFHFSITYCPGRLATLSDVLSLWDNVYPEKAVDFISKNPQKFHPVVKKNETKESRIFSIKVEVFSDLVDQIQKAVWKDKEYKEILNKLARDTPAEKVSTKLQSGQQAYKEELKSAIKHFKKYADRNIEITPDFQPGEKVWLASKNIRIARPTNKLSKIWLGPFEVPKKIGSHAYHLKFPQQWKSVDPVFHVSLLEQVKKSSITNQHQLPPPPVIVEEQEEWEVAQVLGSNLKRGTLW
ncbi:hypothetical protein O181_045191 [Austropuccinia psidii MF-1]|uniref:Reverse transcriptase RNase H-like domain-containing protein n=1 Tax=Austropuccinia psidii MF-1 TaxID=1389203 RepID=A0A9Q3DRV1_9BASI|nr:hypothetical protein [Austropuccinia psidii MF-1]